MSESGELSFGVLGLLSKERAVYGLRNGDHERYRKHCSNKLHRLRQVTEATSGKGKVYKKPPVLTESNVKDVRSLQVLLFSAERALAHSHTLKAIGLKPDHPKSARKEQISWLRRALHYSTALYNIIKSLSTISKINQRTLAEITIYHLSIRAELGFEKSQWAESITDLAARRKLLNTISNAAKDSYDQALALEFMDAYDPLIRFGAYKLGRNESHDIDGVVRDVDDEMMEEAVPGFGELVEGLRKEVGAADMEAGRKDLEDVTFAGEKVPLRSGEIVGVMLRVQEVLNKLGKGKAMKGWDKVLSVLQEAEIIAKKLLEDHQASASATSLRSTDTGKSLEQAHEYIVHLLLKYRIKRDLLLVETLQSSSTALPSDIAKFKVPGGKVKLEEAVKSLAAMIKLYDSILQSVAQIRVLAIVEENDGVRGGVEGLEAYFHATKCLHLARVHCIHPTPSYASAVQLLTRATRSESLARQYLLTPDVPILEALTTITEDQISTLSKHISELDLAAKRALFAERVTKPVFFDTAFNYIDIPMDELLVKAGKAPASAKPSIVQEATKKASQVMENVVGSIPVGVTKEKEQSKSARTTRESTPAVGRGSGGKEEEGSQQQGKGWLGGWFGRG